MSALLGRRIWGPTILFCQNGKLPVKTVLARPCSSTATSDVKTNQTGIWANPTVIKWVTAYEDLVGLTEVRDVQNKVVQAEHQFQLVQQDRRQRQQRMQEIHAKLKEIHGQLEKVQRGDEKYLSLLTEEHQVIREERTLAGELTYLEDREHASFSSLSSAVRESHEKERTRAERTKYWSVSASVIGVVLGILGTSINNYVRMRQLRGLIREQAEDSVQLKGLLDTLSETVTREHQQVKGFITELNQLLGSGKTTTDKTPRDIKVITTPQGGGDTKRILEAILKQDKELQSDMAQIKDTLTKVKVTEGHVLYKDTEEVEKLLEQTESHLEYKMKVNAIWTVTAIYTGLALALPVLYNIFSGGS